MRKLYATLLLFLIGLMPPNFVVASNYDTDHLVFVDKSLPDYKILESSINLQASTVIFINPENYEGILKITEEIQKYDGLKSIHIVGHAKPAELILGSDSFWHEDLNMIQKELNSWKSHLSTDADLFLYGCSLAETEQGKETVDLMASLTGMDVTASTNLTGHSSLSGDWELEYKTGIIKSPIAFSTEIKNYKHSLQSLNYSDLRTFIKVDEGSAGNWTFPDGTGRTAYQSSNTGQPVYLLTKESGYLNQVYKGTITVDAGDWDNDDIGFAFGFNGVDDTYIWSWDKGGIPHRSRVDNSNIRTGGAHLLYHKTSSDYYFPTRGTLIAQGPNYDPWQDGITYQVEILYTENRIKVKVNGVEKFNVTAADAGLSEFPAGKFGFYNYSQGAVTFGNIQNAPASDDPVPPTAQDDSYGMTPNSTLTVDNLEGILKNDYDANLDEFTIVKMSDVSHGTLSLDTDDGSFTYTPTTNYQGADEFTYQLVQNDNGTKSAIRTVTFGIITSNEAPTDIQLSNNSISEGAVNNTSIGSLTTTDANNPDDEHDYSLTDNGGGRFTVNGNSLIVLNSSLLTSGDYSITVRSTDLMGASYTESFTISVIANEKPTSSNTQISMDSGSSFSFQSSDFPFNDTDGDTFGGIRIETAETAGDLEYNDSDVFNEFVINDISLLKFKAPEDASGNPYSTFTFSVVDSRGGISASSYTMSIEVKNIPPVPGNALDFDGTGDIVMCGNDVSTQIGGTTISLEAWIKPTSFDSNLWENTIVSKSYNTSVPVNTYGYDLRCGADGVLDFNLAGMGNSWESLSTPSGSLILNKWQHVAATYDGINQKIYINGVLKATKSASITIEANTVNELSIGAHAFYPGREFIGLIDEVRIWDDVRTETEIRDNLDYSLLGSESNLAAYYNFDNTSGITLVDNSSNSNTGTLTNMTDADWVGSDAMIYSPNALDVSSKTGISFVANWEINYTASKYFIDVSTASDFSSFVSGYENKEVVGQSSISLSITGLNNFTNYYYRLRAFNGSTSQTSVSSNTITCLTDALQVAVATQAVSDIAITTATGNGNITDLGAPNPTQYGVVWNTSTNPTTALATKTTQGAASSTGAFTSSITGLTAGTQYFVRAYATNSAGTTYGEEVSFTTAKISQTITFAALASKTYGDTPFNLSGSASSGLSVSYTSSNTAVSTVSGSTVTIVGVGSTSITASQSGDASYNAASNVVQTLTIDKKAVAISNFSDITKMYFDASFEIDAPSSTSAGAFTYTSGNTDVATISGSTVTILSEGSTVITANQAPYSFYAGGSITATLTVNNVAVVTKHGEKTTSNPNYVNGNGVVGGNTAVNSNGEKVSTKSEAP